MEIPTQMRALFSVLFLFISAPHLLAETLLSNTFDKSIGSWTVLNLGTGVDWSPLDSAGLPTSGSLEIVGPGAYVQRCLPVSDSKPIVNWAVAGKFRVSHESLNDAIDFRIAFYEDGGCALGPDLVDTIGFGAIRQDYWKPYILSHAVSARNIHSVLLTVITQPEMIYQLYTDDLLVGTNVGATTADSRFLTVTNWKTPTNQIGFAQPVNLTAESAYFYFFDPTNVEIVSKIINGCALNGRYWVFAAGLTNIEVTMEVTDTVRNGGYGWFWPQGKPFIPLQSTNEFGTCP
jgi:hypothetical protein